MKQVLFIFLLSFPCMAIAEWVAFSDRDNGDVHFFDTTRVTRDGGQLRVWSRVRFRTSLMGASSFQSLVEIDCSERSERTLQSTFFSDKNWTTPAMATNSGAKPKKAISGNSAMEVLANRLCAE